MSGNLFLAATPIGNVGDASERLRNILQTADVVAAEDSRRIVRLLRDLDIVASGQIISYYEAVEDVKTPEILAWLQEGKNVVVLSDAGMPTISDPGYRLVRTAIESGINVQVIPGPSAVLAALAVSGLPTDRFSFEGFLPRKANQRTTFLEQLRHEQRTMVFFEAPHRLAETISDMKAVFGVERRAVICRELTKTYEEIVRGDFQELERWCNREILGEITLVVEGAHEQKIENPQEWIRLVQIRVQAGVSQRDAIADVAHELGVPKRDVYDAVISSRSFDS